jgi:hypothetical protein
MNTITPMKLTNLTKSLRPRTNARDAGFGKTASAIEIAVIDHNCLICFRFELSVKRLALLSIKAEETTFGITNCF